MMKNVIIATPCFSGYYCADYVKSIMQTASLCMSNNIQLGFINIIGDQFIGNVRNRIVTDFLKTEATDLFFIDDDIGFEQEAFFKLLFSPYDIACGVYRQRTDDVIKFPTLLKTDEFCNPLTDENNYLEAETIPLGFTRIKRHVLDKMVRDYPEQYEYQNEKHHNLFDVKVCSKRKMFIGEDIDFSEKAVSSGFKLMINPYLRFTHTGTKKFSGCLAEHLALNN